MARLVLSDAERDAVTAAVAAAEARTDGEIVTIVTQRSDAYHDVALHYALIAVLAMTAIGAIAPGIFTPFDRGWEEADLARDLLALRRAHPCLTLGSIELLAAANDVIAYVREHEGERVYVALNLSGGERPLHAPDWARRVLLSTHDASAGVPDRLRADEGLVLGATRA